jgi:formyltetrahydrofolate-dependent phosphoribosylglycinamide formyltransferase
MTRARVAILISGAGSNMAALIEAQSPDCAYEIACVLSNKPDAPGLARARDLGVEALAVDQTPFGKDREAHERALHAELTARDVEWVALAGYMRLLTPWFVAQWKNRLINVHPSLLPRYPGLDTHRRALEAGDTEAGCTVHHVIDAVDAGPIIAQARVPVLAGDTPETLAGRVLTAEHSLYPSALAQAVMGSNAHPV